MGVAHTVEPRDLLAKLTFSSLFFQVLENRSKTIFIYTALALRKSLKDWAKFKM